MRPNSAWILAAVTMTAAGMLGRVYFARHAGRDRSAAAVSVPAGEASPPSPADRIRDPRVGARPPATIPTRLPTIRLHDLAGHPESLGRFAGRSLIVNFWATWCGPCREEMPLLESVDRAWEGRRFTVVGIAVDRRAAVARFARRYRITYPLLQGEQDALDAAAALGVSTPAFPFTVFTDRRGELVALYLGELHRPQIELILGVVRDLNADRIDLDSARRAIVAGLDRLRRSSGTG